MIAYAGGLGLKDLKQDHRLLDGKAVAKRIFDECRAYTSGIEAMPSLVSICIGDNPEVAVYMRNQARGAKRAGLGFELQTWPANISQEAAKDKIQAMNDDPAVLGVILQRPVPEHINVRSLQSAIHPLKDVEGMNPASIGNIV